MKVCGFLLITLVVAHYVISVGFASHSNNEKKLITLMRLLLSKQKICPFAFICNSISCVPLYFNTWSFFMHWTRLTVPYHCFLKFQVIYFYDSRMSRQRESCYICENDIHLTSQLTELLFFAILIFSHALEFSQVENSLRIHRTAYGESTIHLTTLEAQSLDNGTNWSLADGNKRHQKMNVGLLYLRLTKRRIK